MLRTIIPSMNNLLLIILQFFLFATRNFHMDLYANITIFNSYSLNTQQKFEVTALQIALSNLHI